MLGTKTCRCTFIIDTVKRHMTTMKERRKEEGEYSISSSTVEFASSRSSCGKHKPMKVESAMTPWIQASSMGTKTGRCTLIVITAKTTITTKKGRSSPDRGGGCREGIGVGRREGVGT